MMPATDITYLMTDEESHLEQILMLQSKNHKDILNEIDRQASGFVTVRHDMELLKSFCKEHPQTVALLDNHIVGYALVMSTVFGDKVPELQSMFELLNQLEVNGNKLETMKYVVMGQICVDVPVRGQGVFEGLYRHMQQAMAPYYDYIVTEISIKNTRSTKAHTKVGFQSIHTYFDPSNDDTWNVVILPTKSDDRFAI